MAIERVHRGSDTPAKKPVEVVHRGGKVGRPKEYRERRVATAIRFPASTHEVLKETADELGVGVNWLVTRLVEEGLERMDLSNWKLVRR